MEQYKSSRTQRMAALFVASALMLGGAAGCSNSKDCVDQNRDGYCDNGSGSSGGSSSSHYYGGSGSSGSSVSSTSGGSSGISQGSHGGIGSSGHSSS